MSPSQGRGEGNDTARGKPLGTLSSQLSLEKIEFAVGWFHIQAVKCCMLRWERFL